MKMQIFIKMIFPDRKQSAGDTFFYKRTLSISIVVDLDSWQVNRKEKKVLLIDDK